MSQYKQSQIAKQWCSSDRSYSLEHRIDRDIAKENKNKNREKAVFFNARTRVKCDCCKQTQFFRDNENIYIKCSRCRTERQIPIRDIMLKSSEYTG